MNEHGPACHDDGVCGYGNPDGGVMLIGIAPGRNEVRLGKPFVGESGRLLDAILKAAGWSRDDVYCTNLVCTWHDEPTAPELAACRPRLVREIEAIRPKFIITLGKIACEETLGWPIGKAQGAVLWTNSVLGGAHSCYVLATYHPAAILHGVSAYVHPIYRDLCKIKDIVRWTPKAPHAQLCGYVIVRNKDHAQEYIDNWACSCPDHVTLDVETAQGKDDGGMLDVFNDRLLCVGLSDGTNTIVIPEEFCHDLDWHADEMPWTFHNGNFDVQAIRRFLGVRLPIVHDTMLMSYNLDERTSGVHGLKFLAREYLGAGFYEETAHAQAKERGGFERVDRDVLYEYNAKDACYTARLAPLLYRRMQDDNVLWPYDHLLIPAANAFADVQYRGINVDMDWLNVLCLKWMREWQRAQDELRSMAEGYGAAAPFNVNSNPQLKHLVFDVLGLTSELGKVSQKTGVPSLDKDVLEELEGQHPFIDALADFRKLDKIVTNYLLTIRQHIKLDGRLHATTRLHGTVTGRTSYTDPPMQTIPNPKYDRNARFAELRNMFVPHNPETHIIVEADYSRAEMWWAVTYSGDENMRADLESGDPHSKTAAYAFRKAIELVTKQDRTDIKHVTFGRFYGRGARAMHKAELRDWNLADVEAFLARWDVRYARYTKWTQQRRIEASTKGELVSLTGRKRRFRLILPDDYKMLNEAVNFPIQNGASDTAIAAMIELHTRLAPYDSYVLLMVHDALVFEIAKAHIDIALPLIKEVMERVHIPGALPVPVELSIGPNWGEMKEIEVREPVHA